MSHAPSPRPYTSAGVMWHASTPPRSQPGRCHGSAMAAPHATAVNADTITAKINNKNSSESYPHQRSKAAIWEKHVLSGLGWLGEVWSGELIEIKQFLPQLIQLRTSFTISMFQRTVGTHCCLGSASTCKSFEDVEEASIQANEEKL